MPALAGRAFCWGGGILHVCRAAHKPPTTSHTRLFITQVVVSAVTGEPSFKLYLMLPHVVRGHPVAHHSPGGSVFSSAKWGDDCLLFPRSWQEEHEDPYEMFGSSSGTYQHSENVSLVLGWKAGGLKLCVMHRHFFVWLIQCSTFFSVHI